MYRKTPHQYLTLIRLEAAKVLLAEKDIRISDICGMIGFESPGSFSTLFSRYYGCSPQYYRNTVQQKKALIKEEPRRFIPHCFIEQYHLDGK